MERIPERLLCSTITFRHLPLDAALAEIIALGVGGVDLGALPGVCDHVPAHLDDAGVDAVAATVRASALAVRSVNADVGDLNAVLDGPARAARDQHLGHLFDLCEAVGSGALVLPNGAQSHDPVDSLEHDLDRVADELVRASARARERGLQVWVEAPHVHRLAFDPDRAAALIDRLPAEVGVVLDVSHVVASGGTPRRFVEAHGDRIRHVHLRDATPGWIHHSIGRGAVDFPDTVAALGAAGYTGYFALELETRDVTDEERPAAALAAAEYIGDLLTRAGLDGSARTDREVRA